MEDFHELVPEKIHGKPTGKLTAGGPVSQIALGVGETRVLALKRYALGPPPAVVVSTPNPDKAFCFQVEKLKDTTKKRYIDAKTTEMSDQMDPVVVGDWFLFQVCGVATGTVQLTANLRASAPPWQPYANPVVLTVTANAKSLPLGTPFATLWANHPLHARASYPCAGEGKLKGKDGKAPPLYNMQCMVRLCSALAKSSVDLSGMRGFTACKLKGAEHKNHFSNPYEFPQWAPAKGQAYTFVASPPYAPEPMPGLAAWWFVKDKTGIILFDHYFDVTGREPMFGGHIDLWNKDTMGNTIGFKGRDVYEHLSAFLRAKKIMFWPVA